MMQPSACPTLTSDALSLKQEITMLQDQEILEKFSFENEGVTLTDQQAASFVRFIRASVRG